MSDVDGIPYTFEEWNKAREIVFSEDSDMDRANAIAFALAEARQKAQGPFLRVASACDLATQIPGIHGERATGLAIAAVKIRRAAEESGE